MRTEHYRVEKADFPAMVHQICSYACNSTCPNCPFTETNSDTRKRYRDRNATFVSPEVFRRTADECGKHGSIMRVTGGGETLLCPGIEDMVEYAVNVGAKVGIITNGSLLTPALSGRFLDAGVDNIEISVDAGDRETYSLVRPGLDWDRLLSNIDYLVRYRNTENRDTKIYVSVIDQKAAASKIPDIVKFWDGRVDYTMVRKYLTFGILDESESGDREAFQDDDDPCPWPFSRIAVDTDGDIILCGHEQVERFTDWGNITDRSIESVWQGEKMQELRRNMLTNLSALPYCKKCDDRRFKSWEYNYLKVLEKAEARAKKHDR